MSADDRTETPVTPDGEDVTIADGLVTITLHKDGTNGKLVVTFDPAELTYLDMTSASVFYSVNDAEADDGKLVTAPTSSPAPTAETVGSCDGTHRPAGLKWLLQPFQKLSTLLFFTIYLL